MSALLFSSFDDLKDMERELRNCDADTNAFRPERVGEGEREGDGEGEGEGEGEDERGREGEEKLGEGERGREGEGEGEEERDCKKEEWREDINISSFSSSLSPPSLVSSSPTLTFS